MDWYAELDDEDNTVWELVAPYNYIRLVFRLKQKLRDNRRHWYADHDEELGGDWNGEEWDDLRSAKKAVAKAYQDILCDE